jgi:hypothetical protein
MIRHAATRTLLEQQIEAEKPGWLRRARARTNKLLSAGKYREKTSIWSEVKPVYVRLQHNKCAYCERQLTGLDNGGAIEHDLEHYRPKGEVPVWPPPMTGGTPPLTFPFSTGVAFPNGYYWLAYEPMNYAASCKKCNTPLKSNFFPIAGVRGQVGTDPDGLQTELPFLIYPLGNADEDPEEMVTFSGITAIPRKKTGPRWRRARVMIDFFKLNSREELLRERANQLIGLANALAVLVNPTIPPAEKKLAKRTIERLQQPSSPHASCIRAACDLYQQNQEKARELFKAADEYMGSLS